MSALGFYFLFNASLSRQSTKIRSLSSPHYFFGEKFFISQPFGIKTVLIVTFVHRHNLILIVCTYITPGSGDYCL